MVPMLPKRLVVPHCRPPVEPPPQLLLTKDPESARAARRYAHEFISYHVPGIEADPMDDALVIVSELVTNALRYGTQPGDSLRLVLAAEPGSVRIEVHDPCRRRPRIRTASDERGRGMFIVSGLAQSWGVDERPMGKSVWAELRWGVSA